MKEMLQFVGDVKVILQGIKLLAKTAGDPLQELVHSLDRKVDEFESYLRSLTPRKDLFPAENDVDLTGSESGHSRLVDDGSSEASLCHLNDVAQDGWNGRRKEIESSDELNQEKTRPSPEAERSDCPLDDGPNPVALITNASFAVPSEERAIEMVVSVGLQDRTHDDETTFSDSFSESKLRCPTCQKGFSKSCHLRQHVFIKHQGDLRNGILSFLTCYD